MNNKRQKILHAYKSYHPDEGGIPTIIKLIAEGLQANYQQEVLCTQKGLLGKNDVVNSVLVKRLASFGELLSLPLTPHYPVVLWKTAVNFDIVDYHFPMPWADVAIAGYFPKKTKLIIHWHSEIIRQKRTAQILSPFIKRCLDRADKIVVADEGCITTSLQAYKEKCVIIPFGIDVDSWQNTNETEKIQIQVFRKQYGKFILGVGRLVSYKGFSVIIKAMQYVDANLVIVGQGPLDEGLQQLASQLNVAHKVHFFGKANQLELKCLYHAAEIFALPSITENEAFGVVQLEAMACNNPIVNTSLQSGVPNVARHQKEALTVAPEDAEQLAQALNQILADANLAKKLAENAFARVNSVYTIERFLEKTAELYDSL